MSKRLSKKALSDSDCSESEIDIDGEVSKIMQCSPGIRTGENDISIEQDELEEILNYNQRWNGKLVRTVMNDQTENMYSPNRASLIERDVSFTQPRSQKRKPAETKRKPQSLPKSLPGHFPRIENELQTKSNIENIINIDRSSKRKRQKRTEETRITPEISSSDYIQNIQQFTFTNDILNIKTTDNQEYETTFDKILENDFGYDRKTCLCVNKDSIKQLLEMMHEKRDKLKKFEFQIDSTKISFTTTAAQDSNNIWLNISYNIENRLMHIPFDGKRDTKSIELFKKV
jgi:hypothetical protein